MDSFFRNFIKYPKAVIFSSIIVTSLLFLGAALPSIWPEKFPAFNSVKIDTDPENMLSHDEPVRLFHDKMKKKFAISDMVVVGIINEKNSNGVFNKETLSNIYELTSFAKSLRWEDKNGNEVGVKEIDIIAPSTVDSIEPLGNNRIEFSWLMQEPPKTEEDALKIRDKAFRIPFLKNTLVSAEGEKEGRALCLYLPITSKNISYNVYAKLNKKIKSFAGDEQYYITGLPVAEDTFGVEMFKQMAISAPLAMVVMLILMLVFFSKLIVVLSPLIVAMMSVIITMGALIIAGFPVHIMSSMIPIFIMPISILDSIHIISEFFDRYRKDRARGEIIVEVMKELFMPMLYTSLTTMAGFASLALTPIPPVQVFGIFVSLGIFVAWLFTITFIPAFLMLIPERRLENFGVKKENSGSLLSKFLKNLGAQTYYKAKYIILGAIVLIVVAVYGISQLVVNDNPVKWFSKSHQIRKADRELNKYFGGTYMAYLSLDFKGEDFAPRNYSQGLLTNLKNKEIEIENIFDDFNASLNGMDSNNPDEFFDLLEKGTKPRGDISEDEFFAWNIVKTFLDTEWGEFYEEEASFNGAEYAIELKKKADSIEEELREVVENVYLEIEELFKETSISKEKFLEELKGKIEIVTSGKSSTISEVFSSFILTLGEEGEVFKQPQILNYVSDLQDALYETGIVGKTNGLVEIVKTINRDLNDGDENYYEIPSNKNGVAECIAQFESSHRPNDLYHFVSHDYRSLNLWVQLKSGDNRDMTSVVKAANSFFENNPAPFNLEHNWFGLTYLNVIWQEKMVAGMLEALLGSFLIVCLMMIILFRSVLWGVLSMLPLTVTICAIYGALGLIGKNYDMPVAVLSSLALGLAVDFAIHFLSRSRKLYLKYGSWERALPSTFEEPARAITRNIIIIAAGFTPLIFATLIPYKTVGLLLASILLVSGVVSLALLPAILKVFEKTFFKARPEMKVKCDCLICISSAVLLSVIIAFVLRKYFDFKWGALTWIAIILIPIIAIICKFLSRRNSCKKGDE